MNDFHLHQYCYVGMNHETHTCMYMFVCFYLHCIPLLTLVVCDCVTEFSQSTFCCRPDIPRGSMSDVGDDDERWDRHKHLKSSRPCEDCQRCSVVQLAAEFPNTAHLHMAHIVSTNSVVLCHILQLKQKEVFYTVQIRGLFTQKIHTHTSPECPDFIQ